MNDREETSESCLPLEIMTQIDQLCDQFEAAWMRAETPTIDDYLGREPARSGMNVRRALLIELVKIDLAYRWRPADSPDRRTAVREGGERASHLSERPRLDDYALQFPELGDVRHLPLELIALEYRNRLQSGESPGVEEYRRRFGRARESLEGALQAALADTAAVQLKLYREQQFLFVTVFTGPLELGRQNLREPPPFRFLSQGGRQRLIIAPLEDIDVSRRHLHLTPQPQQKVRVTSLTRKGRVVIEPGERLHPDDSRDVPTPALIVLGKLAIRLAPRPAGDLA